MSAQIGDEVQLLLISIYSGLIIIVCYDLIRIFRRICYAGVVRSIAEDVIFWSISAIYLFQMFLKYNYGSPRYYSVGAMALTMIFYEYLIGRHIVSYLADKMKKIIVFLLKPLKKAFIGFKLVIKRLFGSIKRILHTKKKVKDDIERENKK